MATIQAKYSRGHKYWYVVESRRVGGKPRPVVLQYLGKADDLVARLTAPDKDFRIRTLSHGAVSVFLALAEELGIADIIDRHCQRTRRGEVPKRDGLSVGKSLVLAAIGRASRPTSKRGWAAWAKGTTLALVLGKGIGRLDSSHFWDQMDRVPQAALEAIETEITGALTQRYPVAADVVFYDTTNFFTFIDTTNTHTELAQRGHNKQRRGDLRQLGLALAVAKEGQLPLFSCLYQGNLPDSVIFGQVFGRLRRRLEMLPRVAGTTIVYDKGNNSKKNQAMVDTAPYHYVAGLSPAHYLELVREANRRLEIISLSLDEQIECYRVRRNFWGQSRTFIVLVSKTLRDGQIRGLSQHLGKALVALEKLRDKLLRARRRYDKKEVEHQVSELLKAQHLRQVVRYAVGTDDDGRVTLRFEVNEKEMARLESDVFGRRILMTSNHDWKTADIIKAYRGQSEAEDAFRSLKDPIHLALRPQFHWTDQKLRVHALICVIGYLLARLSYLIAQKDAGYRGGLRRFIDDLASVRLVMLAEKHPGRPGRPRVRFDLEQADPTIEKLVSTFGITASVKKDPSWCIRLPKSK